MFFSLTVLDQWETLLLQYLFTDSNYNPEARPAIAKKIPVEVRIDMVLLKINDIVERDQEIVVSGFIKLVYIFVYKPPIYY